MLATLMLYICLADGAQCRWIAPPQPDMSRSECMALSQATAARWAASHPLYLIRGISCTGENPK